MILSVVVNVRMGKRRVEGKLTTLGVMMCSISKWKVIEDANMKVAIFKIKSSTEEEYDESNVVVIEPLLFL